MKTSLDNIIYKMLFNYFSVIKEIFSNTKCQVDGKEEYINQWNDKKYIICKTTGFNALILLLKDIVLYKANKNFSQDNFKIILKPLCDTNLKLISQDNFGSGLAAANRLYEYFYSIIFEKKVSTPITEEDLNTLVAED